jgi:predicted nucleotidyltransferase
MQISDEEMKIYRRSPRERVQKRQAADELKKEFSASRVVLFGSLINPALFHLRSDVDLAVWDVQHYFRAVARLLDLDPEIEINLVPFEDARPSLRTVIERDGVEL